MFRNNLSIAVRSLAKNRLSAFLNITGLAVGVTATVLLALYAWYEWSFDRFHQHADRIVRVVFRAEMNGGVIKEPFAMPPVAATLKNDYPEVEEAGRLRVAGTQTIVQGEHFFRDVKMAFADTALFHIFTFPLVHGATGKYFLPLHTVVLSETLSKRLFGAGNPVGKVLHVKDWPEPLQVVAVMRDIPLNAHFQFDLFCSMANARDAVSDSWMQSEFYTYLLLKKGTDPQHLESKLPATLDKYMGPQLLAGLGMTLAALKSKGDQIGLFLQPLTDIHLHSDFNFDLRPAGDVRYVLLFATVAVFILFIACINLHPKQISGL